MATRPKNAILLSLLVTLTPLACGHDEQQDAADVGGEGGSNSRPIAACHRFCENEHDALCGLYATLGDCYRYECNLPRDAPEECYEAIEAFYDCTASAIESCNDEACETESQALFAACN
jgi:hypothetical protein